MDDRETAEVSPVATSLWCVASSERPLRPRIQEYGLKGSIRAGRRGGGTSVAPEDMSAAGTRAARGPPPRSNHSYIIIREEYTTSGYPYGPKVSGGRRRRQDDSQTGGPAETGADPDRGCGDRLLAPRKEQAQDPPAQQPVRFRCPGRRLLGAALRADLLRPHLRDGDRRLDGRHERRRRRHRYRRRLHKRGAREGYRGDVRALFAVEGCGRRQDRRRGQGVGFRDHRNQPTQGARREAARGLRCVEEAPGTVSFQAGRLGERTRIRRGSAEGVRRSAERGRG